MLLFEREEKECLPKFGVLIFFLAQLWTQFLSIVDVNNEHCTSSRQSSKVPLEQRLFKLIFVLERV